MLSTGLLLATGTLAAQLPAAITTDPPADKAYPAALEDFPLPSHGSQLNALMFVASGGRPHPTVILLHGFPGNEKNIDLAEAIRRDGWNVLWFNYRGSWGSPGAFSFTHAVEDAEAALAWLRVPANSARFRSDPNRLVLAGHSMGGMISTIIGARDPRLLGVGLISAADMAGRFLPEIRANGPAKALAGGTKHMADEGLAPLSGCTPESLAKDLIDHAEAWSIPAQAPGLALHPLLVVSSDDGLAPATDALIANIHAIKTAKAVTAAHFPTDHSYNDHRIALETTFLRWLDSLPLQTSK